MLRIHSSRVLMFVGWASSCLVMKGLVITILDVCVTEYRLLPAFYLCKALSPSQAHTKVTIYPSKYELSECSEAAGGSQVTTQGFAESEKT